MASQIELEDSIRQLEVLYTEALARYEALTNDDDNINQNNLNLAKQIKSNELVPLKAQIAQKQAELAALLELPQEQPVEQIEVTTTRPQIKPDAESTIQSESNSIPLIEAPPIDMPQAVNYDADPALLAANEPVGNISNNYVEPPKVQGLPSAVTDTRQQASKQDLVNFNQLPDWRVRLSLASGAKYLYNHPTEAGILKPLQATNGVIFPYTPDVQVAYVAHYDPTELTHNNYKSYNYRNSAVETIQITGDFTAQDTAEASYLLAVIHFFRSVTKMFYGRDQNPKNGTPPPLCYLNGLGDFQFNDHPLAVTSFNYSLPNDVDYIRAGSPTLGVGLSSAGYQTPDNSTNISATRMSSNGFTNGTSPAKPNFTAQQNIKPTYVPTKMQITISCIPIVSRNDISNRFSLLDYGSGKLLRGSVEKNGGIW